MSAKFVYIIFEYVYVVWIVLFPVLFSWEFFCRPYFFWNVQK